MGMVYTTAVNCLVAGGLVWRGIKVLEDAGMVGRLFCSSATSFVRLSLLPGSSPLSRCSFLPFCRSLDRPLAPRSLVDLPPSLSKKTSRPKLAVCTMFTLGMPRLSMASFRCTTALAMCSRPATATTLLERRSLAAMISQRGTQHTSPNVRPNSSGCHLTMHQTAVACTHSLAKTSLVVLHRSR